jgi:hypothetical protein
MAICERRNDRPASAGPQRQRRMVAERSCCLARNAAACRQGKKIVNEPLRAKVGERSERIVARDPPTKGGYGRGHKQHVREDIGSQAPHRLKTSMALADEAESAPMTNWNERRKT